MRRQKRHSAPFFKQPAPFAPQLSRHAELGRLSFKTRVALMQVIEEDTHENYLVCRGLDPECGRFFLSVPVAKPWGGRGSTGDYEIGQVVMAVKATTRLGDNPGKAETSDDQPADLDEAVVLLTDDEANPIAWSALSVGSDNSQWLRLTSHLDSLGTATGYLLTWNGAGYDVGTDSVDVVDYTGQFGLGAAGVGERIRVRKRTISGAVKYEAMSSGHGKHLATLTGNLTNAAPANATVNLNGVTVTVNGRFVAYGDTIMSGTEIAIFYDMVSHWIADNARCG